MKIKKLEVSGAGNSALTCVNMPSDTNLVEVPFTCELGDITTTGTLEIVATSEDDFTGSSEQDYIIDTEKPTLAITSVDALQQGSEYFTKESTTTVVFTAADTGGSTAGVTTECSTDNGASWQPCTSPYTLQLPTATTTLKVRAKDGTGNLSDEQEITVKKDTLPPALNPSNPPKIVARKGTPLNINDVTAGDGIGGSGLTPAGVTHNAATLGLDPANPAAGNYTLVYTAEDRVGNVTTANREVEITDADALIAKIALANDPATTQGKTPASIANLQAKVAAGQAIVDDPTSTQAAIDQALADIQAAIDALQDIVNDPNPHPTPSTPTS